MVIFLPRSSGSGGTRMWVHLDTARMDLPTPPPRHTWRVVDTGERFLFLGPLFVFLEGPDGRSVVNADASRARWSIRWAARRCLRRLARAHRLAE